MKLYSFYTLILLSLLVFSCEFEPTYVIKGNEVFYQHESIGLQVPLDTVKGADARSFKDHNGHFGTDKHFVYYHAFKKDNSHGPSFQILPQEELDYLYAKDKNQVYTFSARVIEEASPASFVVLGAHYAKDRRRKWQNLWNRWNTSV